MIKDISGIIGIVAHDAGGAELIAHLVLDNSHNFIFSLQGPAIQVFERVLGEIENISLEDLVTKSDVLLSGTSWGSSFENSAIQLFRRRDKHVIAFLDHYVNYKERFINNNFSELPDELWVTDEFALKKVLEFSGEKKVEVVGNPYLDYQIRSYFSKTLAAPEGDTNNVLYLFEPIAKHVSEWAKDDLRYDEFTAYSYFLENLDKCAPGATRITLRPHPSESNLKYVELAQTEHPFITITSNLNILDDLIHADVVVGCETMGLILAAAVGKKVFSSIPPGGYTHDMPFTGITFIRDLK